MDAVCNSAKVVYECVKDGMRSQRGSGSLALGVSLSMTASSFILVVWEDGMAAYENNR
jgi:hypothetical protein